MDDNQADYAKDSTIRLIELLQDTFGDRVKTYYQATPTSPPTVMDYPVIVVQKISGNPVLGPTSTDEVREVMQVSLYLNRADDVGSANVRTTTMRRLQNMVEAQDPTKTNEYKAGTLLFAVRTYLTLTQWLINSDVNLKYDLIPQPDGPSLVVCDVTLSTWRRVIVENRQ